MLLIRTAWKNLFRYKRRTFITAIAIAVGVMCAILMDGLLKGMEDESNRNLLWFESAPIQFFAKGYYEEKKQLSTDFLIEQSQKNAVENFLSEQKVFYTERYVTSAEAFFTTEFFPVSGSVNFMLIGVNSQKDGSVYRVEQRVEKGSWVTWDEQTQTAGVVIGSWLAEDIKARVGAIITIQCRGYGGFYQTFDVPIVGIAQTENPMVNLNSLFIDIRALDYFLELDGAVTEINVAFDKNTAFSVIKKRINALDAAYKKMPAEIQENVILFTWEKINEDILLLLATKSSISGILLVFIFIIAGVGITNTMFMAIMERKNEIAMLKALGYTNFEITKLFVYEGFFIGLLGTIIGFVIGILLNWNMVTVGWDLSGMFKGANMGYRITGIFRSSWHMIVFVQIALGSLVISGLSAYIPAQSMVKKEIAELLRSN